MDPSTSIIAAIVQSSTGPAVLILLLVVVALFGMLREQSKAMREDGKANRDALESLAKVITDLRLELASRRGVQ